MASVIYHVVVPFDRNGDGELEPAEPKEAPSAEMAHRRASSLARAHAGVVVDRRYGGENPDVTPVSDLNASDDE